MISLKQNVLIFFINVAYHSSACKYDRLTLPLIGVTGYQQTSLLWKRFAVKSDILTQSNTFDLTFKLVIHWSAAQDRCVCFLLARFFNNHWMESWDFSVFCIQHALIPWGGWHAWLIKTGSWINKDIMKCILTPFGGGEKLPQTVVLF